MLVRSWAHDTVEFVQRTNPDRVALRFTVLVLVAITAVSGFFVVADILLPEWFVIVGRWLPALISLVVIRELNGGVAKWWDLCPGGWRRLLAGGAVGVVVLLGVYVAAAVVVALTGIGVMQPWSTLAPVAIMVIPMVLLFSLSTLGEEAAWRGFLQQTLAGLGFWRASSVVAAVWVLFHIPLHGAMAVQGTIPVTVAVVTTLGLFPLGLYLSAVVVRFGSVWPAVFAHALPLSTLSLLVNVDGMTTGVHWVVGVVTAALVTAAALALAPRGT